MPSTFRIREAASSDLPAARDVLRDARLPLDGFDQAARVFVAEREGRVVGVAALEDHADEHGRAFLLRSVAVTPCARGSEIGTALVHAALRATDQHDAPVALLTETASDHFPRFGFAMVERSDLPSALRASREFQGACAVTARAFIRRQPERATEDRSRR